MSKLNFSLIGILVIFATLITFSSCNKEAELETTNDEVLERILDFKEKVEKPNQQKSGEVVSVEDAVWLIEAALNYSYCIKTEEQANAGTNVIVKDSLFYEVNSNNNNVILADAINTYMLIETDMAEMLASYQSQVKFYDIVDIEYKDGSFVAYVAIRYKEGMAKSTTGGPTPIDTSIKGDWQWGWGLGTCDGNNIGRDLTDEIDRWFGFNKPVMGNVYYTDIIWHGRFGSYPDDGDPYKYYANIGDLGFPNIHMFYENVTDPVPHYFCVSQSDCNYYAIQTNQVIDAMETIIATNRDIVRYNVSSHAVSIFDSNGNYSHSEIGHKISLSSAIRHYSPPSE